MHLTPIYSLRFLSTLQPSCEKLAAAEPKDVPAVLPDVLMHIRVVWTISQYYNSIERLTGLLRKVSNQIIVQCRKRISLEDIFDGDVEACMVEVGYATGFFLFFRERFFVQCRKRISLEDIFD
jgi:hypothetical protein